MATGLAIMYHYVREQDEKRPHKGIFGLGIDSFKKQIEAISTKFTFCTVNEFSRMTKTDNKRYCMLTFDDGLKDHHEVFVYLKEKGIRATFFLITSTFDESKVINSHKMHLLLEKTNAYELGNSLNAFLENKHPELFQQFHVHDKYKRWNKQFGNIFTINFKFAIASLPQQISKKFLDDQFSTYYDSEEKVSKEFYLSEAQIKQMHDDGMEIGCHTHNHNNLKIQSSIQQQNEIERSKNILEGIIKDPVTSISYPYGQFSPETIQLAKQNNITSGVTTIQQINHSNTDKMTFGRIDIAYFEEKILEHIK